MHLWVLAVQSLVYWHCRLNLDHFINCLKDLVQNHIDDKCRYPAFLLIIFDFVKRLDNSSAILICGCVFEGFQLEQKHQRVLPFTPLRFTLIFVFFYLLFHHGHYLSCLSYFAVGAGWTKLTEETASPFLLNACWLIFHFFLFIKWYWNLFLQD